MIDTNVGSWIKIIDKETNKILIAGKISKRKDNAYIGEDAHFQSLIQDFKGVSIEDKWFFNECNQRKFSIEENNDHLIKEFDINEIPLTYIIKKVNEIAEDTDYSGVDIFREYDITELDEEVKDLVYALNKIDGLKTVSSCCGHGENPLWIDIQFDNIKSLSLLINLIWKRFNYDFIISTDTGIVNNHTDHCILKLYTTKIGKEAYEAANKLTKHLNVLSSIAR